MPKRGELRVSPLRAAISCEIKGIDERQFHGTGFCDEIVNNALMEIATGQSFVFAVSGGDDENGGVESAAYGQNLQ